MDKARRKRLSQAEIDSLVQETASKVVPRVAVAATVTLPKPSKVVVGASSDSPAAPIRPLTAAIDESPASIQATVMRLDERLAKAERAFSGFEKQINVVETSLAAERQARDEQAKVISEIKAITEGSQVDALLTKMSDLNERLEKAEGSFTGFERKVNVVETSLAAERQARDEQAKVIGEIKAIAESSQVDTLLSRLTELNERLEKAEKSLSEFEKQTADILVSLEADRTVREEQSRLVSEIKTVVDNIHDQSDQSVHIELASLSERMANLETDTDKFEQYRKSFETALMANRQLQLAQSQAVNTQLKTITQGLKNTLAYDIKKNFKCDCCGADGAVALKIRCTHCEKENWWGWWPKDKK